MALIKFADGSSKYMPPTKALRIWQILNEQVKPTKAETTYCLTVARVYLNWHTAPDDYIRANLKYVIPMALNEWMVDRFGNVTKPEANNTAAWDFARKWGLWYQGLATALVRKYRPYLVQPKVQFHHEPAKPYKH